MQKILIIEDEQVMRQGLADLLQSSGYDPQIFTALDYPTNPNPDSSSAAKTSAQPSLATVIDEIISAQAHLILLDINLTGFNGELLLKTLRAKSSVPVIMLTSSGSEMDEVLSMSYGADDFVTKPYNPQVLLLRIAAVLKRTEGGTKPTRFRDIEVDLTRGILKNQTKRILLTKNEMIILAHLLNHQGEIVTRDALMTDLWNNNEYINDNALTVNVSRVRAKLNKLGAGDTIETRKGLGYVLQ